jgi:Inorganic pyrophosphatase
MTNLWTELSSGPDAPGVITAVVESLAGDRNKYEYDKDIPGIILDRVLHSAVQYPGDYGFIPQTYWDDGDPFDVLILVHDATFPGCVMTVRPVALMRMEDDGESDDKVIAVPAEDPRFDHIIDLSDLSTQTTDEIAQFFETYKALEPGKQTTTGGFEDAAAARAAIERAMELFEQEIGG